MRILIVEDDTVIGNFVEKGFLETGYAVDRVEDAETGLSPVSYTHLRAHET